MLVFKLHTGRGLLLEGSSQGGCARNTWFFVLFHRNGT